MPGSATLGTDLLDDLVGLVDELREDLHTEFGVRSYRAFTILRSWDGDFAGDGSPTDVEIEILPRPLVKPFGPGYTFQMEPCGLDEAGIVHLVEVSLTYIQAELDGGVLTDKQEFFWILREGQSQEQIETQWLLARPPYPERAIRENDGIGWIVYLKRA